MSTIILVTKGNEKSLRKQILDEIFIGESTLELHAPLGTLDTANKTISSVRSELTKHNRVLCAPMPYLGKTETGVDCTVIPLEVQATSTTKVL